MGPDRSTMHPGCSMSSANEDATGLQEFNLTYETKSQSVRLREWSLLTPEDPRLNPYFCNFY